ncbi:bifunctional methylenetetrahydrofolate dehydrogenase/methenyltetrahydrofolate cyclohydrolase [Tetragenococcus koreensis]|uniref:Bifunctional protein FolD n=1 Tax=Tetragenococcus koreensis TaxID=290335 RepID=A0AAN4ZRJ7_9ENTE|nr:bifunctional methylenetetrahydrofolate dehydrogenase/methenyltetrahydrofolate cyclohydrolase [Tetragenococcus koreensis]AYW44513.1 bifunctional methylenetetrahydrofolate dehydrogenase/methenyltetrahydrofolate cyclohydrolase [Tetragenococcus koreensis]MCF1584245.1 bifunctional methylenetetrahydrofolate dehydrogenase/methenyltetrahydrofolate cyclohydrolase [Tetragenococcus koreensis]MCF1613821.1 bifunctional methylenetetrahydrofolate dehydrogenase/methenyltetrahydrofolate cyclohydrolase [Tetrag
MAKLIKGRELADNMQEQMRLEVEALKKQEIFPGLVVFLVGDDSASKTYIKNKEIAAQKIGIQSKLENYPSDISEEALLAEIKKYNDNPNYHGILVQLPLPEHIDEEKVLLAIDPKKDVDGFHPLNMGKLLLGKPAAIPCTPYGIMKMFEAYEVDLAGKNAIVIGRSNIVGKPMAQLLLAQNATVTMAHSYTKNLPALAKQADVIVSAIGKGNFITEEFVKEGAVVIDVGMNRDENGKLIGDVKFAEVEPHASYITPVPKGVGPMTITMLMQQTIQACKRQELS